MTISTILRPGPAILVLIVIGLGVQLPALAQETVFVGPTRAYTTIQSAANYAIANKALNVETIISIDPGVYREFVNITTYTNWPSNDPGNNTPITFLGPGAVIAGSDVFDQWVAVSANRYEHAWLNDWGVGPDPTNGVNTVADIVRRRELVYVNDIRMTQVLSEAALVNNSFFVDEPLDKIVLVTDLDVMASLVEVGVRDRLYRQEWESNVTFDGLTFKHAATEWNDIDSAVKINGAGNVTIRNCVFTENNSRGVLFTSVNGVTIRNTTMNDNGWNGWATWRVTDFLAHNTETSRNNWRGHQGAFYTWNVGNKLLATHGLEIRNHLAVDNFSRGLWLDLDNENVVLDSVIVNGNLSDGIFIEANQGPITIINSEFNNNGGDALLIANSDSVRLFDSTFRGNARSWIRFTGSSGGRGLNNFETGERHTMFSENWVVRRNLIEVTDPAHSVWFNQILASAFDRSVESLDADSNTYIHTGRADAFHNRSNSDLTFDEWKAYSMVDPNSTFTTHPYGTPTAHFLYSIDTLSVTFDARFSTDDSTLQYDWDFGDGSIGTGLSPQHLFSAEGAYNVLLTVTDTDLQTDTVSQVVNISLSEPPQASYTWSTQYLSAQFDGSGSSDDNYVTAWDWDFGDGATGANSLVDHVFADSGDYAVQLIVTDNIGLMDTVLQTVRIDYNPPPSAVFTFLSNGLQVDVDASGSTDDSAVADYAWNFGDDSTSTGAITSHVYDTTGTYNIELIVTDDFGLMDTLSQNVVINIAPTAAFSFSVDSVTVSLDASASVDDIGIVSYDWNFGDDSTGTGVTIVHAYDTTGTYPVELVVIDGAGLTDTLRQDVVIAPPNVAPTAAFTFSVDSVTVSLDASTSADDIGIVSYNWSFGDDSTGTGVTTAHAYDTTGTYQVQLVVVDDGGLTDTLRQDVVINIAPTAVFSFSVDSVTVSLDASASADDIGIVSYNWSFGDDSTGTGVTTAHAYDTTGTYQVQLVVIDDGGLTDTLTQDVNITPPNVAPTAAFTFSVDSVTVNLDASTSADDIGIVSFNWNFGDDSTGTGVTTAHVYDTTGTYQVQLVVVDDGGLTDTLRQDVVITPPSVAPTAAFSFSVDSVTVSLDASASTDNIGIVSYNWSFGDDSTGTGVMTAHAYDTTGTYQVQLVVIDDGGLTDTLTQDVIITPPNVAPTAAFTFSVDSLTVSLDASTSTDDVGIVAFEWSFGDDSTGTDETTSHAYDTTGTYEVQLVVRDGVGATDTLRQSVAVVAPTALLSVKAYLTGAYEGLGLMSTHLASAGLLPFSQPYADTSLVGAGKAYGGSEMVNAFPVSDVVDWILLELRADSLATSTIARRAAFIRANGEIVDSTGGPVAMEWITDGDYYVVLKHRNHVSVMSSIPLTVVGGVGDFDFSTSDQQSYGQGSQLEIEAGVYAICSGDADGDEFVGQADATLWLQENGFAGYYRSDYNLSGGVTAQDNTILQLFSGHMTRVPQ